MGTLVWTDDFESYTAGAVVAPWVNVANSNISTAQAHAGTKSIAAGTGGFASNCYRPIGSSLTTWYADFWMWTNAVGATTNQYIGFSSSTSSSSNTPSVSVGGSGAGVVGIANSTQWFTFTTTTGAWHHYLFEVTSAVAGTAKLTVDGTVVGTYSGDTRESGGGLPAYVWLTGASIGPSPPAEFYVDDLSIYSGQLNTTWNPADLTNVTLSGGNLIATNTAGLNGGVRTTDRQNVGSFYWENTFPASTTVAVGIANSFALTSNAYGTEQNVCYVWSNDGNIYRNAVSVGVGLGSVAAGATLGIAYRADLNQVWFRVCPAGNWNGNAANNPSTGIGGVSLAGMASPPGWPIYPVALFGASGTRQVTGNFGDSAFSGAVPAGFTAGFPATAATNYAIPTQLAVEAWGTSNPPMQATQVAVEVWGTPNTWLVESGIVRETLLSNPNPYIRTSGLVREVLRSSGTGAGTYLAVDGVVREVLRSGVVVSTRQARVMILA